MKRNAQFDLYALSESRPVMMGLAALWIVLFHSYRLDFFQSPLLSGLHLVGILNRLKETGNCGVDIFLFLSGLGLVFSWTRLREKSAHPVREFYRRRISRVLPSVLIVSVLYYGFIGTGSVSDWMGKIFLYGHFSAVLDDYRARMPLVGCAIRYLVNGNEKTARVKGIDGEGGLMIDGPDGPDTLRCGEISLGSQSFSDFSVFE